MGLVAAGSAGTVIGLPADGAQVDNDPAAGIDPAQNAGVSDIVGSSLVAGDPRLNVDPSRNGVEPDAGVHRPRRHRRLDRLVREGRHRGRPRHCAPRRARRPRAARHAPQGARHIAWNLKVGNLHRGRYRVTLRALDRHGDVLGLSRP